LTSQIDEGLRLAVVSTTTKLRIESAFKRR
jgi:hypothetical protein